MIKATIYTDKSSYIRRYKISGHANYAEYGSDIVCAAISALTQTILISLVNVIGLEEKKIHYIIDENDGFLDVTLPKDIKATKLYETQILLKTLVVGIESIIENYPGYINLEYGRCSDD